MTNAGINTRCLSRDEVATRWLHSTSDFTGILSAVTNNTLRQAYETYGRNLMLFDYQVLATDYKAMNRVQLARPLGWRRWARAARSSVARWARAGKETA